MRIREGFCVSAKGIMLATLLTLLGLASGLVIGRQARQGRAAASVPAPQTTAPRSNASPNPKPPPPKPARKPGEPALSTTVEPSKVLTLEEAAAAIKVALAEGNQSTRYAALQRIANAVAIDDIPQALRLADAITYRDLKANFVANLISRWAEADPVAAMTYSQRLTNGPWTPR